MRAALCAAAAALAAPARAWDAGTASADLRRAFRPRPYADSHVAAETPGALFGKLNRHLRGSAAGTRPCEAWDHGELNQLARELYRERDAALDRVYAQRNDKRAIHFDSLEYKEALWLEEELSARAGSEAGNVTRDGKCAELVMWWVHHLPAGARASLARRAGFAVPLLPAAGPRMDGDSHSREYVYQVQCISCHLSMPCRRYATNQTKGSSIEMLCPQDAAEKTPADQPPLKQYPIGQPPHACEVNNKTGKPDVWYNRTKRCEWDFDPPCGVCEGIGGMVWGDGEDQWKPPACRLHTKAEDIPKDNVTTPVWPKAFTAVEYACGNTRGLDACAKHDWIPTKGYHNHYTHYYDQVDMSNFPVAADWPLTGKQPIQRTHFQVTNGTGTEQWTLPNGNMFNKAGPMCVCFSDPNRQPRAANSKDPHPSPDPFPKFDNVLLGPLRWDFPADAVLIAREEIELEWTGTDGTPKTVVADHWNKGPHHFHYDVTTNLMVRQWQAEVALTLQTGYEIGPPDPVHFEVDKGCYKGLFHINLSCIAPPPLPPPEA